MVIVYQQRPSGKAAAIGSELDTDYASTQLYSGSQTINDVGWSSLSPAPTQPLSLKKMSNSLGLF